MRISVNFSETVQGRQVVTTFVTIFVQEVTWPVE